MPTIITLAVLAVTLAATAAIFSIAGLRQFAAGAPDAVTVLGATLELAKLVVAGWLHSVWPTLPRSMRVLGVTFVAAIMALTMLGIFSFLWSAHTEQLARHELHDMRARHLTEQIDSHRSTLDSTKAELSSYLTEYQQLAAAGRVSKARSDRQDDQQAMEQLRQQIATEQTAIEGLESKRIDADTAAAGAKAELGAAAALAKLLGGDDSLAVNLFIGLIMLPFDPLAVWLAVAASHATILNRRRIEERARAATPSLPAPVTQAAMAGETAEPEAPPKAKRKPATRARAAKGTTAAAKAKTKPRAPRKPKKVLEAVLELAPEPESEAISEAA